jgi:hypothetical protein
MDADFSIELGSDDALLDFPWTDPEGKLAYVDVKRHPELIAQIEETEEYPELKEFLGTMNSARSMVETAKCDAWSTTELSAEEEIFDAPHKFASYVDVVLSNIDARLSFATHEQFVRKLVALLRRTPEISSSVEVYVRRCYFGENGSVQEGFYCTLYVSGYGVDDVIARQNWGIGLRVAQHAIVQLSAAIDSAG